MFRATGDPGDGVPAEIRIGDPLLMVSGIVYRDPMPVFLYAYVDDADATYDRAIDGGAESPEDPRDVAYGDRRAMVQDRWNNVWQIARRL